MFLFLLLSQITRDFFEEVLDSRDDDPGVHDGSGFLLLHSGDGRLHRGSGADAAAGNRRCAAAVG